MSEKAEETPGFTMIDLIDFLENDEIEGFCNNIWRLKFHITYGSETCMSQWEKLILRLYPWIEQIEYINKDGLVCEGYVYTLSDGKVSLI